MNRFVFREFQPTGDRLTRFKETISQFDTECEALAAFHASKVRKAHVVELLAEIGKCRMIIKRG
jgi:hypothetical protein